MRKNYVTSDKLSKMLFRVVLVTLFFIPITLSWGQTQANSLYVENFDYTSTQLITANGWTNFSATSNYIPVSNPGLTYSGFPSSGIGNCASLTTTGEDSYNATAFTTQTESALPGTSVYASFLINVSAAQSAGDYFFSFYNTSGTASFSGGKVFIKSSGAGFVMSVGKTTAPATYTSTVLNFGQTYLIVVKHTMITTSTTNDYSTLWINPILGDSTEPTYSVIDNVGTDPNTVGVAKFNRVALRQGNTANAPTLKVDGIRVGTTWASVTGLSCTVSASGYVQGASLTVPVITYGSYIAGNVFTAQLSDASGSFASPVSIGTLTAIASGNISCTIDGAQTLGTGYRIRVVSSGPSVTGVNNGSNISVIAPTNYYYVGSGPLDVITNWGTSTNGSGSNPIDFTSAGQIFNIVNTTSVETSPTLWTVSGTGSKIVLGNSTAAITLTLVSGSQITGTIDITAPSSGHHKIIYKNATTISVGTIADTGLEMVYDGATITTTTTRTYGDVSLINGATIDMSGSSIVLQNLTIDATSILSGAFTSSNYIAIKTGGSVTINGTFKTGRTNGLVSTSIAIPVVTNTLNNALLFQDTTELITIGPASTIVYNRGTTGNTGAQTIEARTYNNLTISNSGVTSNKTFAAGTLNVSGAFTVDSFLGTVTQPSATTINYTGASAQTLPSVITAYSSLGISGAATKTLAAAASVSGVLTVGTGATLATGNFLTLKSDANGTARVAQVLGTISGDVTVERYIPSKRAWRALTAPVKGSYNSIFNNWQNDGISGILTNTGVEIWSNAPTHVSVTTGGGASSMLSYNSSGNNWTPITDTSTAGSLFSASINNPFMVFVTGPYASTNINNASSAATTLRAKGSLIIGQQTYTTIPNKYTFIGNPYASPLSLSSMITSNNGSFEGNIWIWDANTTVANPVGIYNLYNNGAYTNVTSTPVAPTTEIQSGQAFFVRSTAGDPFIIEESNKGTTNSAASTVFRDAAPAQLLRVGLYKQINTEWSGRDGAMTVILADANANQTPNKMANGTENVAFTKNGLLFASEHHLPLVASDVLNVKVWNTTVGANYKLKINTEQFATTSVNATLEDLFTNSRTPLTLDGSAVEYPFAVTTEATSSGNRFRIVFENSTLGINNPKATGISILPNPITGDAFQVNFGTLEMGTYTYSICNTLGQEVEKGSINNVAQNTNSVLKFKNNTAAGMYIMKVTGTDNTVFTAKIIKK